MNDNELVSKLYQIVAKQQEVLEKLAQMDVESFLKNGFNAAFANAGGAAIAFHTTVSKSPGVQQGNVAVADNWVLTAVFDKPLPEPTKAKVKNNFMAYVGRNPALTGKVSLVFQP
jgi:hypothetical protein